MGKYKTNLTYPEIEPKCRWMQAPKCREKKTFVDSASASLSKKTRHRSIRSDFFVVIHLCSIIRLPIMLPHWATVIVSLCRPAGVRWSHPILDGSKKIFLTSMPFGFFTISKSVRKSDRRSARQKYSGKINFLKSCLQWDLISQQQPLLWSLTP